MASFKEVDIEGVQVKIPQDGFASEETLQALVDAMGGRKADGGAAGGAKGLAGATKGAGKDVKAFGKTLFKMNPALTALETGFNLLGSAITGATGLVKSMATADGSFQSLGAVVDFSTSQITRFTSMIPIFGGFFTAVAESTAEMTKLKLAFMDLQRDTFQGLSEAGFRLNGNLGDTLTTVLAANISLDQFGNIVAENTDGLRIFGGTINNAADQFANRLGRLTDQGSSVGMGLRLLGLNSSAIAEEFADFVTTNRLNASLMTGNEQQLNDQLLKRTKNERIITELSGKSIKEQRAAQMAAVADSAFQAALVGMGEQGAELTTFVAGLPGPIGDAVKQIVAFGTVTDEQSARLIATIPGLRETLEENIQGIRDGNISSSKAVADTIQLGQNAIEDGNGLFLAKISMIDPAFAAVADFIMQGRASAIQLENINDVLGTSFTELGQAQEEFNAQHENQLKIAEDLAKQGKLNEENLRAAGMDDKTIGILLNAVKVEDAVGSFQAGLFQTTNNLGLLDAGINALIDTLNKMLRQIDPNYISPEELAARTKAAAEKGGDQLFGESLPGMVSPSETDFRKARFGGSIQQQTEALVSEVGIKKVEAAVQGGDLNAEELREYNENMKVFNREYNDDGTIKKGAPMEDVSTEIKETNRLIGEMIRKQQDQIRATEDISGSGAY